ncbi:O-methyltransferase [Botrytis cinerea]
MSLSPIPPVPPVPPIPPIPPIGSNATRESSGELQGYRIRIHSEGTDALQQCLPHDIYQLFEDTCAETRLGPGAQADPQTGEILPPQPQQQGKGPPPMFRNARTVDRRVLRDVLLTGLQNHVSFGKEFSHYTTNSIDSITITFSDHTSATGTLLVGADGVHSRVRKQFLPSHVPLDTGGRIIYGKTPLSPDFTATFPSAMLKGMSIIRDPDGPIPSITLLEPITFNPPTTTSSSSNPHPHPVTLPTPYIYWQTPTLTSLLPISTHPSPLPSWPSTPTITLLGDAAHAMPPTGASGCVTALRDAGNLVRLLEERGAKDGIEMYEEEMREYGSATIERSLEAAVKMFGFKAREEWRNVE